MLSSQAIGKSTGIEGETVRRRAAIAAALAIFLSAMGGQALGDTTSYWRGYFNALLESRFPGVGVFVRTFDAAGQVTLVSDTCLGPWQRRDIERLLEQTGRVTTLTWGADGCAERVGQESEFTIDIHPLPEQGLFAPLIADPRQPRFSMSYQRYRVAGRRFHAGSIAVGEYFGLAAGFLGDSGSSQVGLQGAVFALFDMDAASKDLINADYWVGLPISYRDGARSYLLRLYHQSSHLGDEFILGNPGVTRINRSYEDAELLMSHEWSRLRLYVGVGHILDSEPAIADWHGRVGAEFIQPRAVRDFAFLAAADVQSSEELDWERSYSYQIGLEFKNGGNRHLRLMLEHFRGHSPNGQFFREYLRYSGVGLYFGF